MKLKILLLEATKIETAEQLIKAIQRGQIQGISAQKFFKGKKPDKNLITDLDAIIKLAQRANFGDNHNAALIIVLKKLINIPLKSIGPTIDLYMKKEDYFDAYKAYFNNYKKQEFKTDEKVQQLTKAFLSNSIDYDKDKKYEQFLNKKFAVKVTVKDEEELGKMYGPDSEGWEVFSPKTFAAASKLACTKSGKKANWCTSASPRFYKSYTSGGNKLYIIRNTDGNTNRFFQMDWGLKNQDPNFKNFQDHPVKVSEFVNSNPSDKLLNFMKHPGDKLSLKDYINKHEEMYKDKKEVVMKSGKWTLEKFSLGAIEKEIHNTSGLRINIPSSLEGIIREWKRNKETSFFIYKLSSPNDIYYIKKDSRKIVKVDKKNPKYSNIMTDILFKTAKKIPFEIRKKIFPNLSDEMAAEPKTTEIQKKKVEFKIIRPNLSAVAKMWKKFYNRIIRSDRKIESGNILIINHGKDKYGFVRDLDKQQKTGKFGVYVEPFGINPEVYGFLTSRAVSFKERYFEIENFFGKKFPRKMVDTVNNFFKLKETIKELKNTITEGDLKFYYFDIGSMYKMHRMEKNGKDIGVVNFINKRKDGIKVTFLGNGNYTDIIITKNKYPKLYKIFLDEQKFYIAEKSKKLRKEKEESKKTNVISKETWRQRVKSYLQDIKNKPWIKSPEEKESHKRAYGIGREVKVEDK